jgi:hypothetical protein
LNTVISVGFSLQWDFAVHVQHGLDAKAITGPGEALRFLQQDFAIKSGHEYWAAVAACSGALRYRCHLEIARTCFVVAYASYMVKAKGH